MSLFAHCFNVTSNKDKMDSYCILYFYDIFHPNWSSVNFQGLYCAISVCMCVPQLTFTSVISCFHFWICMFCLCEKFSRNHNCNSVIVTEFYFSQAAKIISKKKSNNKYTMFSFNHKHCICSVDKNHYIEVVP